MVFGQAFTFNVLSLGGADIAIDPRFVCIGNDHRMLIHAKDTATALAVQKKDAIVPGSGNYCLGFTSHLSARACVCMTMPKGPQGQKRQPGRAF
jgi:hypothetical protein